MRSRFNNLFFLSQKKKKGGGVLMFCLLHIVSANSIYMKKKKQNEQNMAITFMKSFEKLMCSCEMFISYKHIFQRKKNILFSVASVLTKQMQQNIKAK